MKLSGYFGSVACVIVACLPIYGCSDHATDSAKPQNREAGTLSAAVTTSSSSRFSAQIPTFLQGAYALEDSCNLERVDGKVFGQAPLQVKMGQSLVASGWVVDSKAVSVPAEAVIRASAEADGAVFYAPVSLRVDREDVASHLGGDKAYVRSGFEAEIQLGELKSGTYQLQLGFSAKGRAALCDNGRRLVVTN